MPGFYKKSRIRLRAINIRSAYTITIAMVRIKNQSVMTVTKLSKKDVFCHFQNTLPPTWNHKGISLNLVNTIARHDLDCKFFPSLQKQNYRNYAFRPSSVLQAIHEIIDYCINCMLWNGMCCYCRTNRRN